MFKSQHQQAIMKLALTQDDSMLFTADHVGFIYVYDVKQYAFGPEQNPPKSKGSPHFIVILYAYVES